jgi:hypothetical protein
VERDVIVEAIRRCAEANGGTAVGRQRFERLTGITEAMWLGRYWTRWSDALAEAGYEPGEMVRAHADEVVLEALADLVRHVGRFPTQAEIRMRRRDDPDFPSHNVFARFGGKAQLAARLIEHCGDNPARADVVAACKSVATTAADQSDDAPTTEPGEVYLLKSGRFYKIGRSNSTGRRAYEIALQLPERLEVVHVIETDDAVGIERYWHQRFAARRANGEWFDLTRADVAAFRRRRVM